MRDKEYRKRSAVVGISILKEFLPTDTPKAQILSFEYEYTAIQGTMETPAGDICGCKDFDKDNKCDSFLLRTTSQDDFQ